MRSNYQDISDIFARKAEGRKKRATLTVTNFPPIATTRWPKRIAPSRALRTIRVMPSSSRFSDAT
jgi:hypothetical protein